MLKKTEKEYQGASEALSDLSTAMGECARLYRESEARAEAAINEIVKELKG